MDLKIKETATIEKRIKVFAYTSFDILKLPPDVIGLTASFLGFLDCFKLIKLNKEWKEMMNNPHNWPTQLYYQDWIEHDFQWSMLRKKMYDLRVPIILLQWYYNGDTNINIDDLKKFNFTKYMPLETVQIANERVTSKILRILCKRKYLKTLHLIHYREKDGVNIHLHALKKCTKLSSLSLKNTSINGSELGPLIGYCRLTTLILACTKITDENIPIICQFLLTTLDIAWTNIHDVSLPLIKSKNIQNLKLYCCKFTLDGFKKAWSELDDLDHLETKQCQKKSSNHLKTCITNMSGIMQTIINGFRDHIYDIYSRPISVGGSHSIVQYEFNREWAANQIIFENLNHSGEYHE